MNKKRIRTAVIAVLVLLFAATTVLRINIEPADQPAEPFEENVLSIGGEEDSLAAPETSREETVDSADTPVLPPEESGVEAEETEQSPAAEEAGSALAPEETSGEAPASDAVSQETVSDDEPARHVCTLEIRCDTVVDTSKLENQAVAPYVPANGVIMATTEFEFTEGESVFDVLLRGTREQGIHMEFRDDSLYSGKYIEGINYLYEFDGGPLSGWMYKVNGQFPNYGCAAYTVKDQDAIVWMYTCDLGTDVGDNSVW